MTKQIRLIDKHTKNGIFNMMSFLAELAGMPCRDQLRTAEAIVGIHTDLAGNEFIDSISVAPKDYAELRTHEELIAFNADLLANYYRTYLEKSKHAPEQCLESLKQELGAKFVDMMERAK